VPNNNNNTNVIVYGSVVMTTAIARIHPVYLMNADLVVTRQVAADPHTKPTDLGYRPQPPSPLIIITQPES